ncbi:hypothetical protein AB834_05180 [PVC group bacterium (ex Bugula neritina AB1)]|nr:hypothetical protein AB834_05180 [PVC group bacterium (ex Bugula neritina AB1)]
MSFFHQRIENLKKSMQEKNIEALYVSRLSDVRYLTGFTGSAGIFLVTLKKAYFFSDRRYEEQADQEVKNAQVHMIKKGYLMDIKSLDLLKDVKRVGFDEQELTVWVFRHIKSLFSDQEWVPFNGQIEKMAAVKDSSEIAFLKKAIDITDEVFLDIQKDLRIGVSENEIAAKISYLIKVKGGEGDSYDPIVASGPNSSLPHARPSDRCLQKGDFLLMDFGALYGGYHADMTRTVFVGEPDPKQEEIYRLVLKSQMAGIDLIKDGVPASSIDKACRLVFEEAGIAEKFSHATGHGIGLEVHMFPSVSLGNTEPLLENYVITVEPGVYFEGWGGVRIEDDCLVTKEEGISLNSSTKDIVVVG